MFLSCRWGLRRKCKNTTVKLTKGKLYYHTFCVYHLRAFLAFCKLSKLIWYYTYGKGVVHEWCHLYIQARHKGNMKFHNWVTSLESLSCNLNWKTWKFGITTWCNWNWPNIIKLKEKQMTFRMVLNNFWFSDIFTIHDDDDFLTRTFDVYVCNQLAWKCWKFGWTQSRFDSTTSVCAWLHRST